MAEWLRPVFSRNKTPIIGGPSTTPLLDRPSTSPPTEADHEPRRPVSRVPSYLNFRPSSSPTITPTNDVFPKIRDPEVVYHSPSRDQIAESLKVVMMTRGTMEHVPIEHNSSILHVLEAYHDLTVEVKIKEEQIEEVRAEQRKDMKEFEDLAEKWLVKEAEYKTEIKRLEVLLANTEQGMERLTLARVGSVVYGSGKMKDVTERTVSGIKERNSQRGRKGEGGVFGSFSTQEMVVGTQGQVELDRQATIRPIGRRRFRSSQSSHVGDFSASKKRSCESFLSIKQNLSESVAVEGTFEIQSDRLQQAFDAKEFHTGKSRHSSGHTQQSSSSGLQSEPTSAPTSPFLNTQSCKEGGISSLLKASSSLGLGLTITLPLEKDLPFGPQILGPTTEELYKPEVTDVANSKLLSAASTGTEKAVTSLGFSFRPGDDVQLLTRRASITDSIRRSTAPERQPRKPTSQDPLTSSSSSKLRTPSVVRLTKSPATTATSTVPVLPTHTRRTPSTSSDSPRSSRTTPISKKDERTQGSTSPTQTPKRIPSTSLARRRGSRNLEVEVPTRGNSTSSVVTAVRSHSGRSSSSAGKGVGGKGASKEGLPDLKEGVRMQEAGASVGAGGGLAVGAAKKALKGNESRNAKGREKEGGK